MNKQSLTRNAGLNMFRTFLSMAFPLITYPYITRVLGVDNLGKFNFASSIIGYLTLISGFGISSYAIREGAKLRDDKDEETTFVNQMFTVGLLTTLLSYVVMGGLCQFDNITPYTKLIVIQSITLIGNAVGVEWLNSIYEDFAYITIRTFIFQVFSIILMFLFVKSENDLYVYAWIGVLSNIGGLVCNFFHCRKYVKYRVTKSLYIRKHFKPLLTFFFSNLTTTIFVNSDQTMLGLLCGDYFVGLYAIAVKIYNIIKNIFTSVLFVIIPRISSMCKDDNMDKKNELAELTLMGLIVLVVPMSIGIFAVADGAVLIVGGREFAEGAIALKILAASVLAAALSSYITYIHIVPNGHEKILLLASTASAAVNITLNFIIIPLWKHSGAALTTFVSELFVFIIEWLYVRPKINYQKLLKTVVQTLIASALMIVVIFSIERLKYDLMWSLIFEVLCGVITYGICMLLLKNEIVLIMIKKVCRK